MGKTISKLETVTTVGLDLAKNVFQVHAELRRNYGITVTLAYFPFTSDCRRRRSHLQEPQWRASAGLSFPTCPIMSLSAATGASGCSSATRTMRFTAIFWGLR